MAGKTRNSTGYLIFSYHCSFFWQGRPERKRRMFRLVCFSQQANYTNVCCLCILSTVELGAVHALLVILFINSESGVIIVLSSMQQLQLQLVVYMKLQISIKEFFTHDSSVSNVLPVISTRT
ncbi:hypothetical protein V6Z12_A09G115400 [Gossypium hirsutum]